MEVKVNKEIQDVSKPFDEPKEVGPVDVYYCKESGGCSCGCTKGQIELIATENNPPGTIDPGSNDIEVKETPEKTIPSWGPAYLVVFKVTLIEFSGQVIYFGTKADHGVPSVVAKNNRLEISSKIHGKEVSISSEVLEINVEYKVTISQKPSSEDRRKVK